MKYEKCLSCKQLGNTCDGPNFLAMDAIELGKWCDAKRRAIPGMTYDRIENDTGVSKTTIFNFLNGKHQDFRMETIRPLVKYITGGTWDDNPCGNITNNEKAAYENKISELQRQLEAEISWRDDKINHLSGQIKNLQDKFTGLMERHTKNQEFLRNDSAKKNSIMNIAIIVCSVSMVLATAALVLTLLK